MKKKVYLVGAGPGDINLTTVKCLECIKCADVIIYDNLINLSLLDYCKSDCEKIYVGKKLNNHSLSQDGINELLVEKYSENKCVIRLKGGDPFVFGRGGEEGIYLYSKNIPFEVVPGISSSIAALSYAGIPITDRRLSSSFHVITGHEDPSRCEERIDYETLSKLGGTLVFMMGLVNIEKICEKLLKYGKAYYTPAAIISKGTQPEQKVVTGVLGDIFRYSSEVDFPAIIVIGEVVNLRKSLNWYENLPLFGRTILVTRARTQASQLSKAIFEKGGNAIEFPTIEIRESMDFENFKDYISKINEYNLIIFTSVNAVEIFFRNFFKLYSDIRELGQAKLVSIGPATKSALENYGLKVEFTPGKYVSEEIIEVLRPVLGDGSKILIPRSSLARDILPSELSKIGFEVDVINIYSSEIPYSKRDNLLEILNKVDTITFTSSSTVTNFAEILGVENIHLLEKKKVACIGPITSETANKFNIRVDAIPENYTIEGLVDVL